MARKRYGPEQIIRMLRERFPREMYPGKYIQLPPKALMHGRDCRFCTPPVVGAIPTAGSIGPSAAIRGAPHGIHGGCRLP